MPLDLPAGVPAPPALGAARLRRPVLLAGLVVWVCAPFVGYFLDRYDVLSDRWIVEQGKHRYAFMGAAALCAALPMLLLLWREIDWKGIVFAVGWSAFGGITVGPQALIVFNSAGAADAGRSVTARYLETIERGGRSAGDRVRFAVDEAPGASFLATVRRWNTGGEKIPYPRPVLLRRGRLGLSWTELP